MIKVRGVTTTVSATPVETGKTHELSALDHAMGLHHLRMVFYYRSGDAKSLRSSLTEALSSYPAVTGRLRRRAEEEGGNWEVRCNDAGVRTTETRVEISLEEWMRSAGADEAVKLTHWEEMPENQFIWSPFHVQLNEFEGGGMAIGLSCPHIHADFTCATLLVKAWSEMHRRVAVAHPPFFHPPGLRARGEPNNDTKTAKFYAAKSKAKPSPCSKMSTVTLRFSDGAVKKCLADVQARCPDAAPFDVLAALFWTCVVAAKAQTEDAQSAISICIDLRKLLYAPLPHSFYGNALHFSQLSSGVMEMKEGGLGFAAEAIHRHLAGLDEEEYWSAIDWIDSQKDATGKFAPPFRMYGPELTFANMEHLFSYGAMFEKDVKPVHVSYHVGGIDSGEGLVLVLPSPEEGLSRTVYATLPEETMKKVLSDSTILQLEPTVIFGGNK